MNTPKEIVKQYEQSKQYKLSMGEKGLYEQSIINRRFYNGDQWYGAHLGDQKPLVRHNLIKRIGEYKMGDLFSKDEKVFFTAEGVSLTRTEKEDTLKLKAQASSGKYSFPENTDQNEIRLLGSALSDYLTVQQRKLRFKTKTADILKNSFITGTGVLYTYWDPQADNFRGDIACEVLPIENVYFAEYGEESVEKQPYIIIVSQTDVLSLKETAKKFGGDFNRIAPNSYSDNKATLYTKLYKEKCRDGIRVMATSVTEKAVVRPAYNTHLTRYPITIFPWERKENSILGESEITHLLPNQIAINRLLTANVWASMSMGMPIMAINGDTVTADITNDPGQIVKVYGTNEDVKGAIHFIAPPDFSENFEKSISSIISNTLESSGAGMTTLGKLSYNNTAAIESIKSVSDISMSSLRIRYEAFLEEVALLWLDFWINKYGKRDILIEDKNGRWFFPLDCIRYKNINFFAYCQPKEVTENEDD